jgi:hypothetical protein
MEPKKILSFPLRLSPSVRIQATELARQEGISLNHFISLAVAEKISRMEHESWLRQQGKTASSSLPLRAPILRRF